MSDVIDKVVEKKRYPHRICSFEEYENFLIGEYGAEKVLEVHREEERMRKEYEKMRDVDRFTALTIGLSGLTDKMFQ